jgi:predicted ATP-grasp superfamily ATP-dependent carboligase
MDNKVLIVGGDHHNTLGVVESLAEKGIRSFVILITNRKNGYVLHSKYVEKGWCCSDDEAVVQCIIKNFNDTSSKAVVFATNDHAAAILDKYSTQLTDYIFIPSTYPYGQLEQWMRKDEMSTLAEQVGLNVPKSWLLVDSEIPDDITYPVITKAISSVEGSKSNIHVFNDRDELKSFMASSDRCSKILVQQYIDKKFEFQLLGCSLNQGEEVIIPGRTNIDRPNGLDNTFFLKFDKYEPELESVVETTKQFIKATRYMGTFSVEFLVSKSGIVYFTEMNFRNDGNAICVTASGTNIPYIYYQSLSGGDYAHELENSKVEQVYLVPEVSYFSRMLAREFGFKEWRRNMKKANCYTTFFKKDKRAFLWFLIFAIWKRVYRK